MSGVTLNDVRIKHRIVWRVCDALDRVIDKILWFPDF